MSAHTEMVGRDASGREMDRVMVGKVEGRDNATGWAFTVIAGGLDRKGEIKVAAYVPVILSSHLF